MKLLAPLHRFFETAIDPFGRTGELRPPVIAWRFFWFYISQAKFAFLALLVLGGAVALVEAALFYYVGRLVDILDASSQAQGWAGLLAAHGGELAWMLVITASASSSRGSRQRWKSRR